MAEAPPAAIIEPGHAEQLTHEELAPLCQRSWGVCNVFAFWMPDMHGFRGCITAGSRFALVVSCFSGPMLDLGGYSRCGRSYRAVKMGNFRGACRSTSRASRSTCCRPGMPATVPSATRSSRRA